MLCALTSMLFLYRAISMSNCLCQQCQTTTVTLRRKYLMIQRLHHCALQQRPLIVTLLSPLVILKLSHKNMLNPRQRLQRSLAITLTRVILLGLLQNTRQVCFVVFHLCSVFTYTVSTVCTKACDYIHRFLCKAQIFRTRI